MALPHGDDIMLNYQSTGYHEIATLRELLDLKPIKEFEVWMEKMGFIEDGKLTKKAGDASVFLK
jgi:ethanolamine ammonia-lyase large subunit